MIEPPLARPQEPGEWRSGEDQLPFEWWLDETPVFEFLPERVLEIKV